MEAPSDPVGQTPSRQANRWWIALRESPHDAALRGGFEAWRRASPENEAAWLDLERLDQLAAHVVPVHAPGWRAYLDRRRQSDGDSRLTIVGSAIAGGAGRSRRRWLLGGMGMAIAAAVVIVAAPAMLLRLEADHVTGTAELRTVALEDGSTVTLSAASAIAVSFSSIERQVALLEGEAFFQVARDPGRPFQVLAGLVETTAVGTAFDVRRTGDDVTVDVQEGVVQVGRSGGDRGERVAAGESISVGPKSAGRRTSLAPELVGGWRHGRLLTQEVTLRDAVEQLRRHFDGTIILTDSRLGDRRITGAYTLSNPEEALRAIAQAHGAVVRRITPWILVISAS
jgi:transmembrane sensor